MSLTLVLGGARSGKSRHAEALVTAHAPPWRYVATAEAFDDEMRARIATHRARREPGWQTPGWQTPGWQTVEAPLDVAGALDVDMPVLVDCLTLWLTNLMLGGHDIEAAVARFTAALSARRDLTVLVSNEVGLGIVPENALARAFRDEAGRLNQAMAALCGTVVMMIAGLPMRVK